MQIGDYEFSLASSIDIRRNSDGSPILKYPHLEYDNKNGLQLLDSGVGPFVLLRLSPPPPDMTGVYSVVQNGTQVMYIGRAEKSIRQRWRSGASTISPRNCFQGGQSTNCHLNIVIHQSIIDGHRLELFVLLTPDFDLIETGLIAKLQPPWNKRGIR
ncbi:MAG: hypothetical protein WCO85_05645 [Actinomycetes bacterium]